MDSKENIWIQAIKTWLLIDFYAKVECPNCGVGVVDMKDEKTTHQHVIDRFVHCSKCGITETFTMSTPEYSKLSN
jgi:ribosomal protein S27AE